MKFNAKDIYLLFVILVSGHALRLFNSALGLVLLFVFGVWIFRKQIDNVNSKLVKAIAIWLVYVVLAYISIHYVNRFFWFTYVAKIVIAYLLLNYYGTSITQKYVKIIYMLSIISLFFWIWGTVDRSSLFSFISTFDMGGVYGGKGIGIYYIDPGSLNGMFRMFSFCNSGFCWEPGPFGAFVSLAMFFAIAQRSHLKNIMKYIIVFGATIITTQSSTAYITALLVLLFSFQFIIKKKAFRSVLYPFVIALGFVVFTQVPVLREKITNEYESMENVEQTIDNYQNNNQTLSLGRFSSIMFDFETFKRYPIFGVNGNSQLEYLNQIYPMGSVGTINGLGDIIATYGLFGVFFYLFLLIKSSRFWEKLYRYRGWYFFTILNLFIGFSFSIIESPWFVTLLFASIFLDRSQPNVKINNQKST